MAQQAEYVGPGALWRMLSGGALLRGSLYEEVAKEPGALRLSLAATLIGGVCYGIWLAVTAGLAPGVGLLLGLFLLFGHLPLDAAFVWLLASPVLGRGASFGGVVRVLALANAPALGYGALAALAAPRWAGLAVSLWLLLAFLVAIRAALSCGWVLAAGAAVLVRLAGEVAFRAPDLLARLAGAA